MVSKNFLYGTSIFYGEGKGELPLFMSYEQTFKDDHETYTNKGDFGKNPKVSDILWRIVLS
jgi:hypothetical protein